MLMVEDIDDKFEHYLTSSLSHLQEYVSSVSESMLQVLYIDVAKVDQDVAHVVMAIHVCSKYFICSRRMLQVFYLDVAKIDLYFAYTCCKHIFQVF
jgi:hypothetical protein